MLGESKRRGLERPITTSLDALILADQFYRHLERVLDLSVVRDWVAGQYAEGGRPSIVWARLPVSRRPSNGG